MSVDDFADSRNVIRWPTTRVKPGKGLQLNQRELSDNGFQVIRKYGLDVMQLERDLDQLSGGQLYYSDRMGSLCHQYSVLPETDNFSEQMACGGFHTDFMFQPNPPSHIALLCLKPDPRHPFYGRNQIVHMRPFLEKMQLIFGVAEQDLKNLMLIYDFAEHGRFEKPLISDFEDKTIFRFHEKLLSNGQQKVLFAPDMPLASMLNAVMMDVMVEVSLDSGDLLILSNHNALHRRGECSVEFSGIAGKWLAREMASIRFNL